MFKVLSCLLFLVFITSCVPYKKDISIRPYSFKQLQGWSEQNTNSGFQAFKKTCAVINSDKILSNRIFANNRAIWKKKCFEANYSRSTRSFFEKNFKPYLVTYNGSNKGLFTGYFEKELEASLKKDAVYKYPIYKAPIDRRLLDLTRKQIDSGALNGKHMEIAYAKSAAKLFFLQIQGSGVLKLPDGRQIEIGFSGKNNHAYTSIGKYMLGHGLIQHGTAEEIQSWLENNPKTANDIMNINERYVFFEFKKGGPYGSLGVELTPQASLAVDPNYIALGLPLWLQTTLPESQGYFTKLLMAQDIGADIKGPIRGDIFFGRGGWAWKTASKMKNSGSYFILLPKEINPKPYY